MDGPAMKYGGMALMLGMTILQGCASAHADRDRDTTPPALGAERVDREVARQDSALTATFNAHDLTAMMELFDEDLEFYHDQEGLQSREDVRRGFASLFAKGDGIRREVIAGSLEVFPVPGYGAMQIGSHRFCHMEGGREDCGVFDFAHVWKREDGRWRIVRALSYGHLLEGGSEGGAR